MSEAKLKGEKPMIAGDLTRRFVVEGGKCFGDIVALYGIPRLGDPFPYTIPGNTRCSRVEAFCIAPSLWEVHCYYAVEA